jgi:transposase
LAFLPQTRLTRRNSSDAPEGPAALQTVYKRFARWQTDGTWARIEASLQTQADGAGELHWDAQVDLSVVRAHQHAAGARKGGSPRSRQAVRVARLAPNLLSLPGCGVLTAAKLLAETAGVARFRSEACFAMHAGVAPIPVSSGRTDRHRLCRGGNRQLNAAIHRIAITQLRLAGPGQTYYRRRRAQGDSTGDAVRALKRRIARAVYRQLKLAEQRLQTASPTAT